jgi:16S rRNA (cytosine967-C5)-methyltransferase
MDRLGPERATALMEWNNSVPGLGAWLVREDAPGFCGRPGRWLESWREIGRDRLEEAVDSGLCFVQDQSAALVGSGAARLPGGRVLEIGCAPGGKTAHLDGTSSFLAALDPSLERLSRWTDNRTRFEWSSSLPVAALGESLPFPGGAFDKAVIDAPCTGTGVYRRRIDSRWNWSQGLLDECRRTQNLLLDSAAAVLRPEGVLVYSTCSLEPEENELQAAEFEDRHPEFLRIPFPAPPELVRDGMVSIFPPEHGMDGMFAACWRKRQ